MDEQEAFDIEYWSLEDAKLRRLPPEKELDRQIVVVVGAGAGIGKATAHRLVKEGAHVVCVDRDAAAARRPPRRSSPSTARGSGSRAPASATAAPPIGLGLRHHGPREAWPGCSRKLSSPTAASMPWSSPPVSSCRPTRPGGSRTSTGPSPSPSTSPGRTSWPTRPIKDLPAPGAARRASSSRPAPTRSWPRREASPTTPARPRPTTWCASWRWRWRRSCASTPWPRPPWSRAAPCSRAIA